MLDLPRPRFIARWTSAAIDLVVWYAIWAGGSTFYDIWRQGESKIVKDEFTMVAGGLFALLANMYLAVGAASGASLGKLIMRLRLVSIRGHSISRPGISRGLVRSAYQAIPWIGVAMTISGLHDKVADTRIISSRLPLDSLRPSGSAPAFQPLTLALALSAHLFAAVAYAVMSVIN